MLYGLDPHVAADWTAAKFAASVFANCVVVRPRPTAPDVTYQRPRGPDVATLLQTSSILIRESIKHTLYRYRCTQTLGR